MHRRPRRSNPATAPRTRRHRPPGTTVAQLAQLAQALSAIGQITSDHPPDPTGCAATAVMMPPRLVNRAARYLEAATILVHEGVLPADFTKAHAGQLEGSFRQDAASLRYYAGE